MGTEADCDSLHDRVAAHPATGCGSDNNGEGQETTCKKLTGENPWRQPALQTAAIELTGGGVSSLFVDLRRGPKRSDQMLSALTPWMPGN